MANVLEVILSADSKEFEKALTDSEKSLIKLGKKMQSIGKTMSLYVTAPLGLAGGAMIKFASDFNESINKVDVAFKSSSGSVKAFAKTALESFGIAEGSALDMAALFGDMATSMGINTKEASKLSTSMVGLAGDLASFKNMNISEVTTALNGVFTGETESLKRLGVVMTEHNVQQYAISKGITQNIRDMSQAQKVMLRYEYVMAMTSNAHGDFERTGGGAANQMRIFTEGLKQLANEFGQTILPLFTSIVKGMNNFIKGLSGMGEGTKTFIVVIGALAAAIGPVVFIIGSMQQNWVLGLKVMGQAYTKFVGLLSRHPYIALATAIGAIGLAIWQWNRSLDNNVQIQKNAEDVNKTAINQVSKEIANIDRLVTLIKDENVSLDQKKKAIEKLNAINPDYLNGLTLANIETEDGTKILKNYKNLIYEVAKAEVIKGKITELYTKAVEEELKTNAENVSLLDKLAIGLNDQVNPLERNAELEKIGAQKKKEAIQNIKDQIEALKGLLNKGDEYTGVLEDEADAVSNMIELSSEEQAQANKRVTAYEKIIDSIKGMTKAYEDLFSIEQERRRNATEGLGKARSQQYPTRFNQQGLLLDKGIASGDKKTPYQAQYAAMAKAYSGGELVQTNIKTPASLLNEQFAKDNKKTQTLLQEQADLFNQSMTYLSPIADAIGNLFSNVSKSIVDSLAQANTGMSAFLAGMASYLLDLGGMILKEIMMLKAKAIALAIAEGAKEGATKGIVGMVAMGALIAGSVGVINKQFQKNVPKFADGGIVSGPTMAMVGEYSGAKSNPEIIAPLSKLQSMIGGTGENVNVTGEFVVRGQDLVLAIQRADQFKNRIS